MNLEKELELALGRVEPPDGFAKRVMERLAPGERNTRFSGAPSRWKSLAAAALIVLSTGGLSMISVRETARDAAGEKASRELMAAMRIASQKTNLAAKQAIDPISVQKQNGGF